MIEDFDSQAHATQSDHTSPVEKGCLSASKVVTDPEVSVAAAPKSAPPLKLVNSAAVSEPLYKSTPSPRHYFMAEVRKRSPFDFMMAAQDPFHRLYCELPLSFEENQEGRKRTFSLVCEFPIICDDALVNFIEEDEYLLGMVLISFHLQILNNLFLFCATQKANKLIIKATEEQFHGLGIYQEFIQYVDKIPTKKGKNVEIAIPFHADTLTTCDELMDDVTRQFRKTLWQDQRTNPVIRDYLKSNIRLSIVN